MHIVAMIKKTDKFNVGQQCCVNFNVMIAGEECCGKSTFLQSFAVPYVKENASNHDRQLLGDSRDCSIHFEERSSAKSGYLRDILIEKHNAFIKAGCSIMTTQEENALDGRIHCLVYMFGPHRVLRTDRNILKSVAGLVPVVPVLAKADTLTSSERVQYMQEISDLMAELDSERNIPSHFQFVGHVVADDGTNPDNVPANHNKGHSTDHGVSSDSGNASTNAALSTTPSGTPWPRLANIFALVCSTEASGLRVYPWGPAVTGCSVSVSAYDERVSDFRRLQRLVFERGNIARLRDLTQQMTIAAHICAQQDRHKRKRGASDVPCERSGRKPDSSEDDSDN